MNACPEPGCTARMASCDLYCVEHEVLLISSGKARWVAANILRAGAAFSFVAAVQWKTNLPLFVALVIFGVGWVGLPLRSSRARIRGAIVCWIAFSTAAYAIVQVEWTLENRRILLTALLAGSATFGVWRLYALLRRQEVSSGSERNLPTTALAGSFLFALVLFAATWVLDEARSDWILTAPAPVRRWIRAAAIGSIVGTLLLAVLAAAVRSKHTIDRNVPDRFSRPTLDLPPPTPVRPRPLNGARTSALDGVSYSIALAVWRLGRLCRTRKDAIIRLLIRIGYACRTAVVRLANGIRRRSKLVARRIRASIRHAQLTYRLAFSSTRRIMVLFGESVILPALGFGSAAGAAVASSISTTNYLLDGQPADALAGFAGFFLVVASLFFAWAWLAPEGVKVARSSGVRTLNIAGPNLYLLFVAGCWVVGLGGLLGIGPITVGPVTGLGTAGLLAATIITRRRRIDIIVLGADEETTRADSRTPDLVNEKP